jgi:hypothetical protein
MEHFKMPAARTAMEICAGFVDASPLDNKEDAAEHMELFELSPIAFLFSLDKADARKKMDRKSGLSA